MGSMNTKKTSVTRSLWNTATVATALVLSTTGVVGQSSGLTAPDPKVTYDGEFYHGATGTATPTVRAENPDERGNLYNVNMVVVVGDRDQVQALPNWEHYVNEALYQPMSEADVEAFRQRILKDLQDGGFIFSTVSVYKPSLVQGFLKLRVHVGELGKVTVKGNRFRSAEQILSKMEWTTGQEFDYTSLFNKLYALNTNPGVEITSQLRPRQEDGGRRVIDAEFTVKERFPISAAITLSNDGAREISEWRTRVSAQWFNPLKLDDTIGIDWTTAPEDVDELNAVNITYVLPVGEKSQVSLFAGVSQSDLENVLPQLDLVGKGYFFGFGIHRNMWDNEKSRLDATFGWMFLNSENRVVLADDPQERYAIDMSMPRFTLSWASKGWDSFGGRNFITNTLMFNYEGNLGSSKEADFRLINDNASGSFFIDRIQLARFQKFLGNPDDTGSWTIFTRFDAQIATGSLPSSMQKTLGGADNVRGYFESTVAGDMGFDFTIELRTPLISNFIKGIQKSEDFLRDNPNYWGVHRLQGLIFFDTGTVAYRRPLDGHSKHSSISSIGVGLRLTLSKYAQFKLDYGYGIQSTPQDKPDDGRVHFSGQFQF